MKVTMLLPVLLVEAEEESSPLVGGMSTGILFLFGVLVTWGVVVGKEEEWNCF